MKGFVNQVVALVSFLFICACTAQAQTIVPTQTDVIIIDNGTSGKADPGDRIQYKVTIQNTGVASGTGVQLNVVPDPRTTFLAGTFKSSPLAVPDVYTCTGNVGISVPAASGVKTNDFDDNLAGATLSVTTPPTNGTATLNNDGSFTYTPNAGFNGMDVFTYTITDVTPVPAAPTTDMATVTITVSNMIWFVDNTGGGSGGTGTLSNPFKTLANFNASALPLAGHVVFVKHSGTAYRGGIVLKNNMYLFGTGHSGGSNLADSGVLPFTVAVNSPALPAINGSRTVIINDFLNGASPYYGITLASGNTIRGVEVGRCDGIKIFGSNFGTLTVGNTTNPDVALSGNRPALDLTNGVFAATSKFAFINSPDTSTIEINTVSGSLACSSTLVNARDGATAIDIQNSSAALDFGSTTANHFNGGTVISITNSAAGSVTFSNLSIPNLGNGVGLIANAGGTINIGGTASNIIARTALNITNTSFGAGATFASITATNFFSTPGVNLNNVTGGPLVINGGSISSIFATANAFDVNAGSSDITYAGTISYTGTSSARTVEVTARTGGTVTFSGNITANTGTGINVASNTGGTVVFSGASKNLSTGASNAVTLATNTGSTINFTGGGLVITTTTGAGFSATGGGTVTAQGTGNTITSTTGTALNVANTTIGASGLTFQSISANGAANGIVLNTTGSSGGLTVSGTGSAGTGGTIQNCTGVGVSLTSTANTSLSYMNIQGGGDDGINGSSVTGFVLENCTVTNNGNSTADEGIEFFNLLGTCSITNSNITNNAHNNFRLDNTGGTLASFTISGTTFEGHNNATAFGNHGFLFEARVSAIVTAVNITGSTFRNNFSIGMQVITGDNATISSFIVSGCTFSDTGTGNSQEISADFSTSGPSNMTYKFLNNTLTGHNSNAFNTFTGVGAGTTGTFNATISGNTIGNPAVAGSGSLIGNGLRININGDKTARILVDNNTIRQCPNGRGIEVICRNGTGGADVTVTNNNVNTNDVSGFPLCAIFMQSNDISIPNTLRANVLNNTVPAITTFDVLSTSIGLAETGTSTLQLVDTPPASANATAQLTSTNTGSASANAGVSLIPGPINLPPP